MASAASADPLLAAVGVLLAAFGCWIGIRRSDLSVARAAVVGGSLVLGSWSELGGPFGGSAALILPCAVVVAMLGLRRRPSTVRRRAWQVTGGVAGIAVLVVGLFALSVLGARSSLTDGVELAREGVRAMQDGDLDTGAARLRVAADRLDGADRSLSVPWTEPARLVPVVAQHRRAVVDLAAETARAMRVAADALDQIDVERLRIVGGRIDLVALEDAVAPLREVQEALEALDATLLDVRSPWLLPLVSERLDEAVEEFGGGAERFDTAVDAVELAPALLGSDGPRRYLVMFTTPSEARGVGGFPGNYAELVADGGRLSMSGFGRFSDLDRAAYAAGARCTGCPEEFLDSYGDFGVTTGPAGSVGEVVWKNITMPAHFPYIAEAAAILAPQSGRPEVDGVVLMDPYVMRTFIGYTGPVELPADDRTIDERSILPYILFEQYLRDDNAERIDALEEIARTVIDRLLTGALPEPQVLARDLPPLVAQRRLLVWTDRPEEQDVLRRSGLDGSLPHIDPQVDAGFGVTITNAGGSKIDAFVDVDTETAVATDPMTGRRILTATVTIANTAPAEGLPPTVIGNLVDRPTGTNRSYVTFYSGVGARSIVRDGVAAGLDPGREAGWTTGSLFVDVPAGGSTTFVLEFEVPPGVESVVTWAQPLVVDRTDLGPRAPGPGQ
ncbi:MAG: hypothetical protein RLZZ01_2317 [Actinomycetota bacterium]